MNESALLYQVTSYSPRYGEQIWFVIQPDGVALDRTFDDYDDALVLAEELDRAYKLGRKSAEKKPAKGRAKC